MNKFDKLRAKLNQTWQSCDLLEHAMECAGILGEIVGNQYSNGYLVGLSLFLYWQDLYEFDDENLSKYIVDIISLSNNQCYKQIWARS